MELVLEKEILKLLKQVNNAFEEMKKDGKMQKYHKNGLVKI